MSKKPVDKAKNIARMLTQLVDEDGDTGKSAYRGTDGIAVSPASMRSDQAKPELPPRWSFLLEERETQLNEPPRKWRVTVEEVFE